MRLRPYFTSFRPASLLISRLGHGKILHGYVRVNLDQIQGVG